MDGELGIEARCRRDSALYLPSHRDRKISRHQEVGGKQENPEFFSIARKTEEARQARKPKATAYQENTKEEGRGAFVIGFMFCFFILSSVYCILSSFSVAES